MSTCEMICNTNRTRGKDSDANFNACMQAHIATAKADDAALVTRAGAELQVPHLLRATQGTTVRLIALLRNPTNRLYAAFWHYPHYRGKFGASVSGFLKYHREMAGHLSACVQAHGLDACALKFESLERRFERVFYHVDQHFKGVYVPYVRRWSQTFSPGWRTCLLFLRTEDYVANTRDTLARVLSFAGLSAPDEAWWKRTLAEPVRHNGAPRKWSSFPPLPTEARQEVDAFFRPYNEELAALLGDEAFLWAGPSEPPHHLGAVR
ncbi:P-loop containing nucleoside triphosphate hydrolase protein [Pavlovales sp. CCMP2436]|nr:P-loop containing nucleoside triphosphate hydrolase protein [Pavlovales sp. CCMP2436]